MSKGMLLGVIAIALVAVGVWVEQRRTVTEHTQAATPVQATAPLVTIALPQTLSTSANAGKRLFDARCASCHGQNAVGQEGVAPPLVHKIYEPSHHGDESFQRAVARGVQAHHWPFGDMPPVEGLSRAEVNDIIVYIRELQRANGITN